MLKVEGVMPFVQTTTPTTLQNPPDPKPAKLNPTNLVCTCKLREPKPEETNTPKDLVA